MEEDGGQPWGESARQRAQPVQEEAIGGCCSWSGGETERQGQGAILQGSCSQNPRLEPDSSG